MLAYFLQGLALGFPAAATPGSLQAFLLSQTLQNGWKRTIPAAFAPLLSDGPILLLILLILTQTPESFLNVLRIGGGLFLLYLAWGAFQAFRRVDPETAAPEPASAQQSLLKAAAINLLNPNPYIFWSLIAGPILLAAWRQAPQYGLAFLLGFYGTLVGGFAILISLFAVAHRLDPRLQRLLSGLSAAILFGFGLYQLWTGLRALLGS
jgi:threonine/homoserine/homoserine lactone efflux protein